MNSIYYTEEHKTFRKSFRYFLKKEVVPNIEKWEKTGFIERFIWKKFGDMGYLGLYQPEKYGGLNLDLFYTVIFLEEMQRINSGGFAAAIWAHCYLNMSHLKAIANDKIKQKYLTSSISGDKIGCLCITEPFGGSDVAGMRTTALKKSNRYIINGSKTFITNGIYSDYLIVAAKTDTESRHKGISIFLIDRDTPGISVTKLNKLGWKASDTAEIYFNNVEISKQNLLGDEGKGFNYIMQHFSLERLIMGINAHARAGFALDYAIKYMEEREAFGKKINKFQALRHKIAEMAGKIDMCKEYNYSIAKRLDQGKYVVKEASMSKLLSTKIADEVIYESLQILGGYGYMEDYPLARMLRDSRIGSIGGGTSEILKEIIAKIIIDGKEYKPVF